MNIQIFGTKKCNDTKKAERFFKERGCAASPSGSSSSSSVYNKIFESGVRV